MLQWFTTQTLCVFPFSSIWLHELIRHKNLVEPCRMKQIYNCSDFKCVVFPSRQQITLEGLQNEVWFSLQTRWGSLSMPVLFRASHMCQTRNPENKYPQTEAAAVRQVGFRKQSWNWILSLKPATDHQNNGIHMSMHCLLSGKHGEWISAAASLAMFIV